MTTAFPTPLSPQKPGRHTLKNRICMSAHAESLGEGGVPTERALAYYEARVRGGAGFFMCFGSASVHPDSSARVWNGIELFDDRVIPYLSKFSEATHKHGVPLVAQMTHKGRRGRSEGNDFRPLLAPSAVREPNHREGRRRRRRAGRARVRARRQASRTCSRALRQERGTIGRSI